VESCYIFGGSVVFVSKELDEHLKKSHTVETESAIYAEWNLNDLDNTEILGNYRYRPGTTDNQFSIIPNIYDPFDNGGYYTGATQSNVTIQAGVDDEDSPTLFTTRNKKMEMLYSLDECVKHHRPRSGINKILYLGEQASQYLDIGDKAPGDQEILNISRRPRYYMASRHDQFKYWTSYRNEKVDEEQQEFGISRESVNNIFYIYDACPFVVYKENVPTNKIVIKMQTNVGEIDLGTFREDGANIQDPFFGFSRQTTPQRWKIEVLKENNIWTEIISFDENSRDSDGNQIIKSDGYVEISYGIQIPEIYKDFFVYAGIISNETLLPEEAPYGYAYLIQENPNDRGIFKIFDNGWQNLLPEYSWSLSKEELDIRTPSVTKTSNPEYFINEGGQVVFREFDFIRGIRIVVETMNRPQCTFDVIEISPRLFVDITDKTTSFNITKTLSDLGNGSIPVGNLNAAVGSLELFDDDFSFSPTNNFNFDDNTGSILAKYVDSRVQIKFYQIIKNVQGFDYFIPIKTMYADEVPSVSESTGKVQINLRDLFFLFESAKAPELLITDVSISYAVTLLLDFMGFSNVVFKRISNVPEIIIPYFFIAPDQNIAEVLQQLAVASQTGMFFDEYNNLVVMSKEYLLPELEQRSVDSLLLGQNKEDNLPNIINVSSEEKKIYNDGRINYTARYLQRSISKYRQAAFTDKFQTFGYKPSLLWEVSGKEQLRSKNELPQQSEGFVLSAAPLNSDLDSNPPFVQNGEILNNIVDVGENIDSISSYNGYFYANGEIIKYDAIEYAITGPTSSGENLVWILNTQEYQRYFSKLPFNGKMYPTGNIRIFAEPEYVLDDEDLIIVDIKKHGRGQFDTPISSHSAGIDPYWTDKQNVKGCVQLTEDYLFNTSEIIQYPSNLSKNIAGKSDRRLPSPNNPNNVDVFATNSSRNGIIKNFRANKYYTENEVNYFQTTRVGTLQSSALVFKGPEIPQNIRTADFVSYVYKELPEPYKHFGTRMRIVGKIESTNQKSQTAQGAFPIFETVALNVDEPEKNIQIFGGSGGLAFNLNKDTNVGYYFEILSLTQDNIDQYTSVNRPKTVNKKILASPAPSCVNNTVTVRTETQIDWSVGQKVIVQGLVDSLNPLDTRTPLNGEYKITAIGTDKKSFQYVIPGAAIANRTSTTGGDAIISELGNNIVSNVYFYKVVSDSQGRAIPYKLWSGIANILVDDGKFTGQYRFASEENPTVYDLSAEYINIGNSKRFFLYINDKQVATVTDTDPLPDYNNMALFVRGSSRCMFENIYALGANISQNSKISLGQPISKVFGSDEIDTVSAFKKYALNGVIQKTYLSGIGSEEPPSHIIYFDEFGTIMREAAYLNVKYDRAFPALYARIMKTFNRIKGYSVSGFYAGSYGADFLIFNCTDSNLNLDDTTGNYLRVQGIAFTQNTTKTLSVDDYYKRTSNFSDPVFNQDRSLINPFIQKEEYNRIINSRTKYGVNEFTIESPYIQTDDVAEDIFGWTLKKISVPKILVGLNTFSTFNLQLGDIVNIEYKNNEGINIISEPEKRFVVYSIEYNKSIGDQNMTMYLAEV
jgi:hypothetical protein